MAWLERFLEEYPGTVVAVTHDRYFLDNVAGWILELDRGKGIPWRGNYSSWLEQKGAAGAGGEGGVGPPEGPRPRARVGAQLARARQAKSRPGWRATSAWWPRRARGAPATWRSASPAPRLGDLVLEAEGVTKGYGDRLLMEDLSFSVPGGIVGVIGANGAGKTTLFRMIVGQEAPDEGRLRLGDTVELAYVDQSRDALDPGKTVWEEVSGGQDLIRLGGREEINSRAYVASFNFRGSDQQKPVGQLSAASATACTSPSSWRGAAT